jgi:membrane fusion protein, hemolysin D
MMAASRAGRLRLIRPKDEREFLPAALEIIETPASPVGRAIGSAIIAFFLLALAWTVFGRVDIVATAPGKIVPTGRSKVIQPLEGGIVRAIHVRDGDNVKAGDLLIELDPTESQADRNRLAGELLTARLEAARLEAMLSDSADHQAAFITPPEANPAQVELSRQLIASAMTEFDAKLAELDRQAAREEANHLAVAANIEKLQTVLPLLREQLQMRRTLFERNVGSKLAYLDAQERVVETERELSVQQSRLNEAEASAAAAIEARRKAEAEQRSSWLSALADVQAKAQTVMQDLVKADQHRRQQVLAAPVDGVVQQLAVHTIGGVVKPADTLMLLVPTDSQLEIEAVVANSDIGFVHAGQKAKIKVDAFPFTRYGLIDGKLLDVSPDSTQSAYASPENSEPEQGARQPGFIARVALESTSIEVGDQLFPLRPGMAVTVEVDTGVRRIIEYLLSPLIRHAQESMKER